MAEPLDSSGSCQSALVDKLGVSLSQYHPTVDHIANHPGMNNRPVEAAILKRQSHPIIASLPILQSESTALEYFLDGPNTWMSHGDMTGL
jgi:hypothetical protein